MSKSVHKSLIGAFVLGAIVLGLAAVVILGSGRLFDSTFINVMYFRGSVKGLAVGSPVMFRGVKVGSVKKIELQYDGRDLTFIIPVYVEFEPSKMVYIGHKPGTQHTEDLIKKGLRAKLEMQSLVTGQLMINIDMFGTDKPIVLVGLDKRYDEIPTIPSDFENLENLEKRLENLPIEEITQKLLSISKGIDRMINSPETQKSALSVHESVGELKSTIHAISNRIGPIMDGVNDTSNSLRSASAKIDGALSGDNGIPSQIRQTLSTAQDALRQAEKTLKTVDLVVTEKSAIIDDASNAIEEITSAARSLRFLTDYIERHPEGLIRGKKP
jgi:paraquat-inducible protein B